MSMPHPDDAPDTAPKPSKPAQLRDLLTSPELTFLMEAHDGLSAKIVQEAGFTGVWASGLAMSAALGVRDSNEASWTQVLEVLEFMSDATSIPILVDGDTGYGNFNNMRRLVKKLGQRGIAGVCIEDKLFPKTNSFIGNAQPLADIDEFCGKIKAGKDSREDEDFCVVARIEALISGWGMDEALRRAEAYHGAGADALLVHSKISTAAEILAFAKEWDNRLPVVIVPTMYASTPTDEFRKARISTVIWANHNLRGSIKAMRDISRAIHDEETVINIEGRISSVKDIFELAGNKELADAEKRYLPATRDRTGAIVLAASRGSELGEFTEDAPKCMIDVRGKPLLRRLVSTFRECGIGDVAVVRGYKKDAVSLASITTIDNDDYDTTGEVASLAAAIDHLKGSCVVAYGDILFRRYILSNLLAAEGDIVLVVDALWHERAQHAEGQVRDLVACDRPYTGDYLDDEPASITAMAGALAAAETSGEWIGLVKLTAAGAKQMQDAIKAMEADGSLKHATMPDLFVRLIAAGATPKAHYITGHWLDVDNTADLARARNFL